MLCFKVNRLQISNIYSKDYQLAGCCQDALLHNFMVLKLLCETGTGTGTGTGGLYMATDGLSMATS